MPSRCRLTRSASSSPLAFAFSPTGVVLVGDLRGIPLIGELILADPGPWLVNEGMGAEGALTGLVALIGCSHESGLIGA